MSQTFLPWSYPHYTNQQLLIPYHQAGAHTTPTTNAPRWQCPACPAQEGHPVNSDLAHYPTDSSLPPDFSFPSSYPSSSLRPPSQHLIPQPVPQDSASAQDTQSYSHLSLSLNPSSIPSRLGRIHSLQHQISTHQAKVDRLTSLLEDRLTRLESLRRQNEGENHQEGLQVLTQLLAEIGDTQRDISRNSTMPASLPLRPIGTGNVAAVRVPGPPNRESSGTMPNGTVDPKLLRSEPPPETPPPDFTSSQISSDASQAESLNNHELADNDGGSIAEASQSMPSLERVSDNPAQQADDTIISTPTTPVSEVAVPLGARAEPPMAEDTLIIAPYSTGFNDTTKPKAGSSKKRKFSQPPPLMDSMRQLRDRNKTASSSSMTQPATLPKRAKQTISRNLSRGTGSMNDTTTQPRKKRKANGENVSLPFGTLGKSNGVMRVPGVTWPKRGPNTIRGVGKDIQCETCQGRLHWSCAGFKETESLGPGEWNCPECEHLAKSGLPPLPVVYSDNCVRSNCVRRLNKKTEIKPGDAELYMIERPIGRKTVVPATLSSGATFAYLIKWWGYELEVSTWEPTSSFGSAGEIASQFIDLAMDEGVSPEQMRGSVILLEQAKVAFDEKGELKKV